MIGNGGVAPPWPSSRPGGSGPVRTCATRLRQGPRVERRCEQPTTGTVVRANRGNPWPSPRFPLLNMWYVTSACAPLYDHCGCGVGINVACAAGRARNACRDAIRPQTNRFICSNLNTLLRLPASPPLRVGNVSIARRLGALRGMPPWD